MLFSIVSILIGHPIFRKAHITVYLTSSVFSNPFAAFFGFALPQVLRDESVIQKGVRFHVVPVRTAHIRSV